MRLAQLVVGSTVSAGLLLAGCSASPVSTPAAADPSAPRVTDCLTMAADADKLIEMLASVSGLAAEGFQAVARGDAAGVDRMTEKVNELSPKVTVARAAYDASAKACKAAAR